MEVKESIELVQTAAYGAFLKTFFSPFMQLLAGTPPQPADNPQHKLRNLLLEILNRCVCEVHQAGMPAAAGRQLDFSPDASHMARTSHIDSAGAAWGGDARCHACSQIIAKYFPVFIPISTLSIKKQEVIHWPGYHWGQDLLLWWDWLQIRILARVVLASV